MPRKREYLVLADFDFCPRPGVVMAFKAGRKVKGLTRACLEKAGDRVQEIGGDPKP